jgi:hypothetical protein
MTSRPSRQTVTGPSTPTRSGTAESFSPGLLPVDAVLPEDTMLPEVTVLPEDTVLPEGTLKPAASGWKYLTTSRPPAPDLYTRPVGAARCNCTNAITPRDQAVQV